MASSASARSTTVAMPPPRAWRAMQPLHTDDGVPLHLRHWGAAATLVRGEVAPALGTVLIVHGLGEHLGRYDALAADLNAAGWDVAAYDHRGHGASGGARGRIPRDDSLLRDLGRVIDQLREECEGPLVLLGHSLGGLVAARFVAQGMRGEDHAPSWHRRVEALVLSSPALALALRPAQKLSLKALSSLAPDLAVGNGLDAAWISRDPGVIEAYRKDPLVHDRVTPRLVRFMIDSGAMVREQAAVWSLPTLLMWAGDDRCVDPAGSAAFAADAPREYVSSQAFAGFAHEIFNETRRAEPIARMTRWLAEQFA